jgi:NAD(P)-dependent dehydrogenase (short-subunit alcohol dehydrogenase family)
VTLESERRERIAIVTGAGTGIGRAASLALLQDGWTVVLAGRRSEPLDQLAADAATNTATSGRVLPCPCDVSDPEAVKKLFATAVERFGRVDLLFNNAGISNPPGPFEDWTVEQWKSVIDVNLNGMFYCIQQAFRVMRAQTPMGGRIINNGSISATSPRPNSIAYTASKHAVEGMTKSASLDGRKYDIAVGQIDIGNAQTELAARMAKGVPQANGEIAAEPMLDVNIVGQSVRYMASLPLEANILFHTVMPAKMPFVGRG